MKFTFKNIGPISDAELDLGDLTVIAGRNNTGKTYLVYTLYGFLKMARVTAIRSFAEGSHIASMATGIAETLMSSRRAKYAVDSEAFNDLRQALLCDIGRSFSENALPDVFSHSRKAFRGASIEALAPLHEPHAVTRMEVALPTGITLTISYEGSNLSVSAEDISMSQSPYESREMELWTSIALFDFLLSDVPLEPFILSAERFGISLFYRELDFTKNQLVDILQKMGSDRDKSGLSPYFVIDNTTSRYALPIKDNIDYTRNLPDIRSDRSDVYEDKLFDAIKDMMGGYYTSSADGDIRFLSKTRKEGKFDIPLHLASSSARGLSDLYFFLRHVAKRDQLLMIDEPESHLDTANQMEMARLLARFVRAGIKVLITTHSDYIIKEFNNLIMLHASFEDRDAVARRLGYRADDYLPPQAVRGYVAEGNGLRQCRVDRFGIDMPVFDESIDRINLVANDLVSKVESNG